jgi:hypothetical protein
MIRLVNSGRCDAIPTGQLLVWQARIAIQPMACIAAFDTAIASAPIASAFIKSADLRKSPVITSEMSLRPILSKCRRAWAKAGIVETEILSRKMIGAAPIKDHTINAHLNRGINVFFYVLSRQLITNWNASRSTANLVCKFLDPRRCRPFGKALRVILRLGLLSTHAHRQFCLALCCPANALPSLSWLPARL